MKDYFKIFYCSFFKSKLKEGISTILLSFLFISIASAQQNNPISIFSTIQQPYSPYFSDYFSPSSTKWETRLVFNDITEPEWDVRLRITIESSKVKLQTRQDYIPPSAIRVFPGVPYSVTGADLAEYFQYNNLIVNGISPSDLSNNGKFPEGFYNFCIEALDYKTGTLLSQKSCTSFWIQLNDEPITITPICGSIIKPNPTQTIPFQWHQSNAVSPNSIGTEYQLALYEITDPLVNPLFAIQNSKVLKVFESDFISQNTFVYDMTDPILDVGKKYVYTIQARDIEGKDIFKNKGISQACWFYYGYPAGGLITLKQPINSGAYGINDAAYFKWSSPNNIISGQVFSYQIKIVEMDSSQTPEDAMLVNPSWYNENTVTTTQRTDFDLLINKRFTPQTNYAWQVTAFSDGQQIAQSPVYAFYGPPVIDRFFAGNHEVLIKTTFNKDLNNLSGVGIVKLSEEGKTQEVNFSNLRLLNVAGRYVLNYGTMTADLIDTGLIQLAPKVQDNQAAYFHPQKFRLDKNALELYGNVSWSLPHAVTSFNQAYVISNYDWINFDKLKLSGHAVLNTNNQFTLLDPYQFKLNLFSSSDILIDDNIFNLRLDGEVVVPDAIKCTDLTASNFKISFKQTDQLFYISNSQVTLSNNILPLQNSNIVMSPSSYIIDLSELQSPLKLSGNTAWKGIYFPKFRIDFNTDADRFGQLVFNKLIPVNYELSASNNYKSWIGGDGLNFSISKKFLASDQASFNKFPAVLDSLKLEVQKNSVQNSSLTGSIIIPFVSTTQKNRFTCPISNSGFEPAYLDSLNGTSFTFNKDGGDQRININITRAVFADKERLDMTLDLEWPSLDIKISSLTGFKAWGNYNIGFLLPNGTMALATQAQGKLADYPVSFDGIGAGSSNGAYAFGLTGKAVIAEDVSGPDGPPALNLYTTVPNSLLPKSVYIPADSAKANSSIPANTQQNSYEDNVAIIKNDFVKKLYESNVTVTDQSINTSEILNGNVSEKKYESSELIDNQPAKSDSTWSHASISLNQQALVDEIITALTVVMSTPFTDKITAVVDSQKVKVTSRIDKIVDSINVRVERTIHKLVDSLAGKAVTRLKKEDFDPTAQVYTIADTVAAKLSFTVRGNFSNSVNNNIKYPMASFINNEISGRTNTFIEQQVRLITLNLMDGKVDFNQVLGNLADAAPVILHGAGNDAFAMINMERVRSSLFKTAEEALIGVKLSEIDNLLMRAIEAEAGYIVSKAISNKASDAVNKMANNIIGGNGEITASAGLGIKMNFENLGRNLKEGKVDKIVKLDAVSVALKTKFVSFGGMIYYTANDEVYGNIWKGGVTLNVNLPKKFALEGIYINGRKGDMPYWFCQISGASASGKPGAAMDKSAKPLKNPVSLGIVDLVGASGRLYHHMTDVAGQAIVPDIATTYGASVSFVFFDGSSNGRALRLALGAGVEIKEDGNYIIDFEGDMQAGNVNPQVIIPDMNCMGGGGVSLNYNSAESHFLGKGWFVVKSAAVCAKGNILVDVKPGYFNVQVGNRDDMIMITPVCFGWGGAGWIGINTTTANAGLGLSYSINTRKGFSVGPVGGGIDVNAGVAAGVDATIQYRPSIKLLQAGIWVDLWAGVGIDWHTALKSGYISLVNINCKGDLTMTFDPPPTTLAGVVHGHVEVLCFGLDFDAGFEKTL